MKKIMTLLIVLITLYCGVVLGQGLKKDGVHKEYFATGELKSETTYKDGVKHGIAKIYDRSGRLLHTVMYEKGKMAGAFSSEPERDLGSFNFLKSITFWIIVGVVGVLGWFVLVKVLFKDRPR